MAVVKKSSAKKAATKTVAKKAAAKPAETKPVVKKAAGIVAKAPVGKAVAAPEAGKKAAGKPEPSYQQIAELAHRYWRERGSQHGSDRQDWIRAERTLRSA